MPTPIRPNKANGREQNVYWIRKKVPKRYRALVGKGEVWKSLGTTDLRTANARIAIVSLELEQEWVRLGVEAKRSQGAGPGRSPLTHQDLFALQRETHIQIRDANIKEPGGNLATLRWASPAAQALESDDQEELDRTAREILTEAGGGVAPTDTQAKTFKPLLIEARTDGYLDIARAARGSFADNSKLADLPKRTKPKIDILEAFDHYCSQSHIKGQLDGPTAKRWRPVINRFIE